MSELESGEGPGHVQSEIHSGLPILEKVDAGFTVRFATDLLPGPLVTPKADSDEVADKLVCRYVPALEFRRSGSCEELASGMVDSSQTGTSSVPPI